LGGRRKRRRLTNGKTRTHGSSKKWITVLN
jgi:hypothetical protein